MSSFIYQLAKASSNAAFKTFADKKPSYEAFTQHLAEAWQTHEPQVWAAAAAGRFEYEFNVCGNHDFSISEVESMLPPALGELRSGINTFVWKCHDQYTFRYSIKIKWMREHDELFKRIKAQNAAKEEEKEETEPAAKKQCTVKKEEEEKPAVKSLPENLAGHEVLFLALEDGWVWGSVHTDLGAAGLQVEWEAERDVEGKGVRKTVCTKLVTRNEIKDHRATTTTTTPVKKQHSREF